MHDQTNDRVGLLHLGYTTVSGRGITSDYCRVQTLVYGQTPLTSIRWGLDVQHVVRRAARQIHNKSKAYNKSTTSRHVKMSHSLLSDKSTTNRSK